jgi:ribosomal protein S18 acetylase RimI-like enzyme
LKNFNPDEKRFYEKNGCRQVGEIPNLYRDGITEYLMLKEIA